MKIFVTGGNGFIGSRVVRLLCQQGYEVRCLLRHSSSIKRIRDLNFERLIGDIHDPASLADGLRGCQACIHLASVSSWAEITTTDVKSIIVEGTRLLLQACSEADSVRLVYVSSAAAVNASDGPKIFDETARFELEGMGLRYATAKHKAEQLVLQAVRQGMNAVVVNPVETYGPEDYEWITAGAIRQLLRSPVVFVVRGGTSVAHVDDVAQGIVLALQKGRAGQRYILGGENLSVEEIARHVLKLAGYKRPLILLPAGIVTFVVGLLAAMGLPTPFPREMLAYARRYWFMDFSKAQRELGYCSRPASETLRSTVDWILRAHASEDG